MESAPNYPLRALGIGEIFDRAVTIYVRNFAVFTLMVLTILAPYSLVQYAVSPAKNAGLAQTIDQIEHPEKHTKDAAFSGKSLAIFGAAMVALVLLSPIVAAAGAAGVAAAYNEQRPNYRESFLAVLPRWPQILGAALLELCIIVGVYVASLTALILIGVVAVLAIKPALPLAVLLFVLLAIAVLAVSALFLLLFLSYAFATYSAALEGMGAASAVGTAFRRIFNRREIGKSLLIALSYVALEFGVLMISTTVSLLLMATVHQLAIELIVNALVSSALTAFLTIVIAVYYFDVRTRAEGLDLEVALQRLSTP